MFGFRNVFAAIGMIVAGIGSYFAQAPFTDNLNWVSTSTVTNAQSPEYSNSTCEGISYAISTSSSLGFRYQTGGPNGTGAIFPGTSGSATAIPIAITFNTPVENPAIYIRDLDEDNHHDGGAAEEYLSGFSPTPSGVQNGTANPIYLSGGTVTPYDNSSFENNNTAGWVYWTGTFTSLSFTYYRDGSTYEFVVDSIRFSCPCPTPIIHDYDTLICPNNGIVLQSSFAPVDSYTWNNGATTPDQLFSEPGTYWVKSFIGSCWNIDSFTVATIALPTLDLGNDAILCEGNTIELTVSSNFDAVTWQDGSTGYSYTTDTTGYYSVTAHYQTCIATDGIQVALQLYPVSDLDESASICSGAEFTASVSAPNSTFLWSTGSTANSVVLTQAGTYFVVIDNGCVTVDSIELTVIPLPPDPMLSDTVICPGGSVTFSPSEFYSDVSYQWWNGSTEPYFTTPEEGTYWLQSWQNGCSRVDTVSLSYYPILSENMTYDSVISKCEGKSMLIGVALSSPLIDIVWENGDTTDYIPISTAGTFSFTVSTPCETKQGTITVTEEQCYCNVYLPNAFTPDGNIYNNVFQVKYDCPFDTFELLIFNRWGELIYSSTNPDDYWDGTYIGQPAQDGVYVYKLKYTSAETQTYKEMAGHVSVLR